MGASNRTRNIRSPRDDKATGEPKPPPTTASTGYNPLLPHPSLTTPSASSSSKTEHEPSQREHGTVEEGEEGVYSPSLRLEYTPPVALPSPFSKTLKVEGLKLYLASASLIHHAMNALYTHLNLRLVKVLAHMVPPPNSGDPDTGGTTSYSDARHTIATTSSSTSATTILATPSTGQWLSSTDTHPKDPQPRREPHENRHLERSSQWEGHRVKPTWDERKRKVNREKYPVVRKVVMGTNRVSGGVSEWEIASTYTFSPTSGLLDAPSTGSILPLIWRCTIL
ncbi:hypothetical protein BKA70DRAFT_1360579 [Coprinopsis sp. MPI-PUGE-AT-0042]|nr:hypothetical protein BKA70DRAFT_1360579 [Coprinopsis sp. MPI-PUGE-AT-0042]